MGVAGALGLGAPSSIPFVPGRVVWVSLDTAGILAKGGYTEYLSPEGRGLEGGVFIAKTASGLEMRAFNQRKAEVLEFLEGGREATAGDVARELGISPVSASRLLGHYFRQGLLSRRTADRFGTKAYTITEKGRERLRWIRGEL